MVYSGAGIPYADLRAMDFQEYLEAVEARVLYNEEWRKRKK